MQKTIKHTAQLVWQHEFLCRISVVWQINGRSICDWIVFNCTFVTPWGLLHCVYTFQRKTQQPTEKFLCVCPQNMLNYIFMYLTLAHRRILLTQSRNLYIFGWRRLEQNSNKTFLLCTPAALYTLWDTPRNWTSNKSNLPKSWRTTKKYRFHNHLIRRQCNSRGEHFNHLLMWRLCMCVRTYKTKSTYNIS